MGIRYVDIRVKYCDSVPVSYFYDNRGVDLRTASNGLCIYHGASYCNLNFDDVQNQVVNFLKTNPN